MKKITELETGEENVMELMMEGRFCGHCHNGFRAFNVDDNCDRCHDGEG